jgi:hypothetical protein
LLAVAQGLAVVKAVLGVLAVLLKILHRFTSVRNIQLP